MVHDWVFLYCCKHRTLSDSQVLLFFFYTKERKVDFLVVFSIASNTLPVTNIFSFSIFRCMEKKLTCRDDFTFMKSLAFVLNGLVLRGWYNEPVNCSARIVFLT